MAIWFDLKYASRLLIKSWGYSLICASVVALSVGLAVWTWALTYSQLFKPLPFAGSERWYSIQIAADASNRARPSVDAFTYQQIIKHVTSTEHLGAYANRAVVLSEGEATTSLRAGAITPALLSATRVSPLLGRMFDDADGHPGAAPLAVLSYQTWQSYFAGDPAIIGKTARIDAAPVQIIGVMPEDFFLFLDHEVWMPLQIPHLARPQDSTMTVTPFIVLKEKRNLHVIAGEMKAVIDDINRSYPRLFSASRSVALIPASRLYTHSVVPIITMMCLMAGGILLLGCVNISMVFLARLLERSRELALRTALGSSRPRLIRQCLLETALIVVIGLIAGYALAYGGIEWTHGIDSFGSRILADGRSSNLPVLRPVDFVAAVVFAIAVWLLSTLVPAWRISKQDAATALGGSGKGAAVRSSNRSVGLLVGLQVIISCVVLVTCGNVVLAIRNEVNKPNGLQAEGVMLSTYPTAFDARYSQPEQRLRYWENLTAAIEGRVSGSRVAFTTAPPTRPARVAATIEKREGGENYGALTLPLTVASEGYFDVMGIRLRRGRLFDSTDNSQSLPVAIVDEKMAARFWPDEDVLGKRVRLNAADNEQWMTIVGVVSAVRGAPYRTDADIGVIYQPLRQIVPSSFHALVRVPGTTADNRVLLRAAAYGVDRDLPLHNLQTFDDYIDAINLSYPAMAKVFMVIALITAMLAASGLFGLISRSVAQRTQEVGIRRALGATTYRATSMFLRQGAIYLSVAVTGMALGVMMMPLLSRPFPNILERAIPVTSGVVLLMAAIIFTASYLPTRRAVALEPGDALHYE